MGRSRGPAARRGVRALALIALGWPALPSLAAGSAAAPSAPPAPVSAPEAPPPAPAASATTATPGDDKPIWQPDQYFYAEGFAITTRLFPEDPAATVPAEERGLFRAIWAWSTPLEVDAGGLHVAATALVEASILESGGHWESFDQNRLCLGLAVWGRRVSVWNQIGRCYSPARDPYAIEGPDPMVGFASVFWAYRTDNPFRQYGWRTDVNLRPGDTQLHLAGMLALDDAALADREHARIALDRAIVSGVWRFPNACRLLGVLSVSFHTSAEDYGGLHATCEVWGAVEWGVGGIVGGPHNENGHGLQVLNRISRTLPNGQMMELIGTATTSFLRWNGKVGQLFSLGGEGTWRFANGVGMTAGAFRVWLDQASLVEGGKRGQTETELFINLSWLYQ